MSADTLDDEITLPARFAVDAYPDPFNGRAAIRAALPGSGDYSVQVVDILGRVVYSKSGHSSDTAVQTFFWTPDNIGLERITTPCDTLTKSTLEPLHI